MRDSWRIWAMNLKKNKNSANRQNMQQKNAIRVIWILRYAQYDEVGAWICDLFFRFVAKATTIEVMAVWLLYL